MKRFIINIFLALMVISCLAQPTMNEALRQIEANNTAIQALKKRVNANQIINKTGIYLANPEVEFNYLFGHPTAIGNRTDFSISQQFDFPTAYIYEKQLAEMKNEQLMLEFEYQKRILILQAKETLLELIYTNALLAEYEQRMADAEQIAKAYQLKIEHGECSQLDLNKANLNWLNARSDYEKMQMEKEDLLSRLSTFNGGEFIGFEQLTYEPLLIPSDFETWYKKAESKSPLLQWLKQDVKVRRKEVQLNKAKQLPSLQAGYMSEKVVGEQFQGIALGVSIPLWENKNKVRASELNADAAESSRIDEQVRFYEKLSALHAKAISLQTSLEEYEAMFKAFNSSELLKESLNAGEISLIEYLYESALMYDGIDRIWELRKALNLAFAELNSYALL